MNTETKHTPDTIHTCCNCGKRIKEGESIVYLESKWQHEYCPPDKPSKMEKAKPVRSSQAHTPGPWIAVGRQVEAESLRQSPNIMPPLICEVEKEPNGEANAALIASAPDMAKELAQLKADKAELVEFLVEYRDSDSTLIMLERARQLIAKHSKV